MPLVNELESASHFSDSQQKADDADPLGSSKPPHISSFESLISNSAEPTFSLESPAPLNFLSSIKQAQKLNEHIKPSSHSLNFLKKYYPSFTKKEWNSWQWQLTNSITDFETLEKIIKLTDDERAAFNKHQNKLPIRITPYYASIIDSANPDDPLRKCMIPVTQEFIHSHGESDDPLGEDNQSPAHGLIHRYPDRVLFLSTGFCFANCRYCTRSRIVGHQANYALNSSRWEKMINYIENNKNIRDVLISGGDPLTLQDEHLEYLIARLRSIAHIEIIRIGTKAPVVLPQRITNNLIKMLKRYHPLWMNIHFSHPNEITSEVIQACNRLADAGIPLGSQTVLLKGVNDSVETLKTLYRQLLKARVRPYYLYQCDPISGSEHFRTSVDKGLEMIKGLRGYTTGFAVPQYVIDAPNGGGKTPLLPDYYQGKDDCGNVILKNFEGKFYKYPDYIKD